MKIASSDVRMWSQNVRQVAHEYTLTGANGIAIRFEQGIEKADIQADFDVRKEHSPRYEEMQALIKSLESQGNIGKITSEALAELRFKLALLWFLLLKYLNPDRDLSHARFTGDGTPGITGGTRATTTTDHLFYEAHGSVETGAGEVIPIHISLKLSDTVKEHANLSKEAARAMVDPLVVNFAADSVSLTREKFEFDIDIDGKPEKISMPAAGSAFLALDKNGDGVIGDGSELFGTKSGDGFKDLAVYDDDKNGFIDENDPVFEKLCLFTRGPDGKDIMLSLREKGIAAISLQNLETSLRLSSAAGQLRKTGFFIRENRTASTIQHVDLKPEPITTAQNSIRSQQQFYEI